MVTEYLAALEVLRGRTADWWRLEYHGRDTEPDTDLRDRTRAEAIRLAADPPAARPSAAESVELLRLVRACPYRSAGTGCSCSRCGLRGGGKVATLECMECVRRYG